MGLRGGEWAGSARFVWLGDEAASERPEHEDRDANENQADCELRPRGDSKSKQPKLSSTTCEQEPSREEDHQQQGLAAKTPGGAESGCTPTRDRTSDAGNKVGCARTDTQRKQDGIAKESQSEEKKYAGRRCPQLSPPNGWPLSCGRA